MDAKCLRKDMVEFVLLFKRKGHVTKRKNIWLLQIHDVNVIHDFLLLIVRALNMAKQENKQN